MRREPTQAERAAWQALRRHRPRFARQPVVGHYIVDIACRTARVAVELDGGTMASGSKRMRPAPPDP
ncbi:DUF559 domain-containing protein [Sphingomonas sp. MMS24-JH45]